MFPTESTRISGRPSGHVAAPTCLDVCSEGTRKSELGLKWVYSGSKVGLKWVQSGPKLGL